MTTEVATRAIATSRPLDLSTEQLGTILVRSGFFADTKDQAQAIVKVLAGAELGFGPIASMQGVYIVKGKVSLSANLVGAAIKRSGRYDYRVREMTAGRCAIAFYEHGKEVGVSTFSQEDAKTAGLAQSDMYRKFPRNMLFSRALTNGARWYCPDVFNGPIYTPDELGAQVDEEGRVIEASVGQTNGREEAPLTTDDPWDSPNDLPAEPSARVEPCSYKSSKGGCGEEIVPTALYQWKDMELLGKDVIEASLTEFERFLCIKHLEQGRAFLAAKAKA